MLMRKPTGETRSGFLRRLAEREIEAADEPCSR